MAAFQEEQTFFRLHLLKASEIPPFSIIPPLCPCPDIPDSFAPELEGLVTESGWILHPCNFTHNRQALSPVGLTLPGYPPLPRTAGFILGYAGDWADNLTKMVCPGTKKLPKTPFPVNFWYRANVTIEYTKNQKNGALFAQWTIGKRIKESRSR